MLDLEGVCIGVVDMVQGISWQELTITGQSNHAGTTPMRFRHDAGYVAARIAVAVREIVQELGGEHVGTVGAITVNPNLINVVAASATLTIDLRNTHERALELAERRVAAAVAQIAAAEGVEVVTRNLARFEPVHFDPRITDLVEQTARQAGLSTRRMPSGAGHDAQMFARVCPAGMIFVPSVGGLSHNPAEHTALADLEAGTNVLLHTVLALAEEGDPPWPES